MPDESARRKAMARFTVLCRVDAFIDYVAYVEANSAAQASTIAANDPDRLSWRRHGEEEFDSCAFFALDAEGNEIPESQCGDF
jgi:muconolactone delta-isomerase